MKFGEKTGQCLCHHELTDTLSIYNCTKKSIDVEILPIVRKDFFLGFFPNKLRLPPPLLQKVRWLSCVLLCAIRLFLRSLFGLLLLPLPVYSTVCSVL
jgi:hypothetical protein